MTPLVVNIGQADTPNANKRAYPRAELERAILDINQDSITQGRVFGQVGMPGAGHTRAEIDKIAFIVGNLQITDGGDFNGEVVWLETEAGRRARAVYEQTAGLWSFRPCGIGKTREVNGVTEIYDYRILSINMVLNGA